MMDKAAQPHIAILMCTCNGEKFLAAQLDSFVKQTHKNWSLWIADDGSNDATVDIINAFKKAHPEYKVNLTKGPEEGFSRNFMMLLKNSDIDADYVALSDQDDVWLPRKLEWAIAKLTETGAALYGGRTRLIDEAGNVIGLSPLFPKGPSLENALVQSIMGGNTMVFSKDGFEHFRRSPDVTVLNHDWWIYLYLTASDCDIYYDPEPMTLYRQHEGNLFGANTGLRAKLIRLIRLMRSDFKEWNLLNIKALKACEPFLSQHGREMTIKFQELQETKYFDALRKLSEMKLTRQTRSGELALIFAAFIGKI